MSTYTLLFVCKGRTPRGNCRGYSTFKKVTNCSLGSKNQNRQRCLQVHLRHLSPSAFLTFVQKWDLFYKKLPHFRRRRIFAAVLINQAAIMELNECRLIYGIFCKISFFLLSKLKRCGLRHHEFKDSLWVWQPHVIIGVTHHSLVILRSNATKNLNYNYLRNCDPSASLQDDNECLFGIIVRFYHEWLLLVFS